MKETNPFFKGFGLTCGAIGAVVAILLVACCACTALVAISDPSSQRVYQNILQDLETPARDRQPTRTPGPTPTPVIFKFEGQGDDVVFFTVPADGLAQFSFSHSGDGNFAVKLLDESGSMVDLLVNEIGAYQGQRASRLTRGQYALEITANGNWSAVAAPAQ